MDANPCACESSRSQLSHAPRFISKSLTVASEYSFEIINIFGISGKSPEMTAFSSEKLKGERDHSWSSRKQGMHCMDANASACEGSRSQLSYAQEFKTKSCMVAPEYLIENVEICEKNSKILPNTGIEFLTRNIPISVPIFSNL